jgi:FAD/FMN-containing dehydrogenase
MRRRTFCKNTLAASVAAALPGCGVDSEAPGVSTTIAALSGNRTDVDIEAAAVTALSESMRGRLMLPADKGYDAARTVWNGMFDKHPALIAQCQSTTDVVNAVSFASERNLLVAVKGGGHSLPGKSTCDGGMVIDLSQMHGTDIDVSARTVRVDGGALLGHIDDATHPHNLATTTGIVSHTGAGGFTLGGGYGRTDRLMGLAVDNLLAATVVSANGEVLRASDAENEDLYWAIRGGGGNFGVATEFVYRLHPFNPTIYGGTVQFRLDAELLRFYGELAAELPNEASIEPQIGVAEDGSRIVTIEVCYAGDHAVGEKVIAPLLTLAKPLAIDLGALEYREMQTGADDFFGRGRQYYLKSGLLTELTSEAAEIIVDHMNREQPVNSWFQHLGGVPSTVAPDAMAYSHRDAALNFGIMVISDDPATMDANIAKARAFYKDIEPHTKGFYTNLNDDTEKKTWGNYGENYPRLVEAKNKYDPTNLFRLNANIKPSV